MAGSIKSFRDLLVWQKSMDLVIIIYKTTNHFPKYEIYGLSSQMQRAAVAVPSNIAEGFSRRFTKEYSQFLSVAYASVCELETQLEISHRLGYLSESEFTEILERVKEIERMMNALLKVLRVKTAH